MEHAEQVVLRETASKLWARARLLELAVLGLYEKSNRTEIGLADVDPMCELAGDVERLAGDLDNMIPGESRLILPELMKPTGEPGPGSKSTLSLVK